jgi:hypothetical protein
VSRCRAQTAIAETTLRPCHAWQERVRCAGRSSAARICACRPELDQPQGRQRQT